MIKGHVVRALQVSYLTKEELQNLQAREKIRLYLIPNWNIQECLKIPSIKERYGIPFGNDEAQNQYHTRIEKEIYNLGLFKVAVESDTDLDYVHQLDWNIFHNKEKINWDYSRGGSRERFKKLAEEENVPF